MGSELMVRELDGAIERGIAAQSLAGRMERTLALAGAVQEIASRLTPEVMAPVMALQGRAVGFRTDKDMSGGYSMEVVRDCLIEAAMAGVFPCGNEFNIIGGRAYVTKEGMGRKLASIKGLSYHITPGIPRTSTGGAVVTMTVAWTYGGKSESKDLEICTRVNTGMGADAILGKATRKARAWLWQVITGQEVPEGETEAAEIVSAPPRPRRSPFKRAEKAEAIEAEVVESHPSGIEEEID
jgi:hypothetical protein